MKSVAKVLTWIAAAWFIFWMVYLSIFVVEDTRNPFAYINIILLIMSSKTSWALLLVAGIANLLKGD